MNLTNTEDTVFPDSFIVILYDLKCFSRNMLTDCMIHSIPLAVHSYSTAQEIYCVYGA
jgi:hypothetical protein